MSIPPFNDRGWLPDGIHDCTLEQAAERFGSFQRSDRRPRLWHRFQNFFFEVKATSKATAILLNGSFVTAKPDPNDIDLILVLPGSHDFSTELSPSEYNALSALR